MGGKLRIRQITLKVPDKNRKSAEKMMEKARQIYREAMTGADFAQLAKKYSQDPLASKGGDLGSHGLQGHGPGHAKGCAAPETG